MKKRIGIIILTLMLIGQLTLGSNYFSGRFESINNMYENCYQNWLETENVALLFFMRNNYLSHVGDEKMQRLSWELRTIDELHKMDSYDKLETYFQDSESTVPDFLSEK